MDETNRRYVIIFLRFVELLSISVFILGAMWQGADMMKLSLPQFMMLYGLITAVASELAVRVAQRAQPEKFRPKKGGGR